MRWQKIRIGWVVFLSLLLFSCEKKSFEPAVNSLSNQDAGGFADAASNQPPFATKEPEKYSAEIVFAFRYDETAANFLEQTYFVARDGANRRLDFKSGAREFSRLQLVDGKQFILLAKQKLYAELNVSDDKSEAQNFTNQPNDFSLNQLLYAKPIGATYVRVGEETVLNRQTTKYRLTFDAAAETPLVRTETFVWADANLGLPIKTEIIALENNQPTGAKNIIELREIKTEVDPNTFEIPADFRQTTFEEIRKILRQK